MIQGNILIIDDDAVDRRTTQRALERAGWKGKILQACVTEDAIEKLQSASVACILLDYRMPGQNGLELMSQLRSEANAAPPIIMLTGEGNELIAVEAMKRGAFDYLPKDRLTPAALYRAVSQAVERACLQQELAEAHALLERQALYDGLTGLGNRNLFMRDFARCLASARRKTGSFSLLLMDLNKFKAANDQFGHEAGDFILTEFGRRACALARLNDAFYRLGGDEFTALVEAPDADSTLPVARRVLAALEPPFIYRGNALHIGISIGIALYPGDGASPEALLAAADRAMYLAKRESGGIGLASASGQNTQ